MSHRLSTSLLSSGAIFLVCSALASGETSGVVAVRFWSLPDATRVVVEATGDFHFNADRAHDPERIFCDMSGTRLKIVRKGQHTVSVGDKLIKQIRIAETQPGTTRVVFDIESAVEFTASQLSNPDRLIVEFRPAGVQPPVTPPVEVVPPPQKPLPQPATVPPPAVSAAPVRVDAMADPTHGREKAISSIPASLPQSTRARKAPVVPATIPTVPAVSTSAPPPRITQAPARPARLPKNGEQSLTRVLGLKVGRIVLDAGHGGHDEGTHGPSGFTEKDLVLDVTKRLGQLIESRMGSEVIYTRSDDTFVPLESRTHIANDAKADLFLSVHANSSPERNSSGVETYYLNFTTSQSALEVAARENASSQKTVYELKDLLQKIALRDKVDESREFASRIQTSLYSFSARNNARAKDRGVKKAPFVVLIGASMPSVLVEIGFITNPRDESAMKKPEYRQKLAESIYKGLSQYASTLSHFQVASRLD